MTNIQARAIEKARREFQRAQNELQVHRLSETRYRGVPTISDIKEDKEAHGTFVYRGIHYTKWFSVLRFTAGVFFLSFNCL
mgnify:CR=1 FL=1